MREIKFRAWDTEIKEMVRFLNLNITKGEVSAPNCSPLREDGFEYWNFKPMPQIILLQYTGLKDSKGVEIYEGDIVTYPYSAKLTLNMKVVWLKHGWYLTDETVYYRPAQWYEPSCEVIGNIWESPELLK